MRYEPWISSRNVSIWNSGTTRPIRGKFASVRVWATSARPKRAAATGLSRTILDDFDQISLGHPREDYLVAHLSIFFSTSSSETTSPRSIASNPFRTPAMNSMRSRISSIVDSSGNFWIASITIAFAVMEYRYGDWPVRSILPSHHAGPDTHRCTARLVIVQNCVGVGCWKFGSTLSHVAALVSMRRCNDRTRHRSGAATYGESGFVRTVCARRA